MKLVQPSKLITHKSRSQSCDYLGNTIWTPSDEKRRGKLDTISKLSRKEWEGTVGSKVKGGEYVHITVCEIFKELIKLF